MKKAVCILLTVVLALVSVLAMPLTASASTAYQLDFTASNMVFDPTNNVWTKAVGDMSCLNYPGYAVVDTVANGGSAAIRKFVAPTSGPLKLAWGAGVYIDNSQGNLTGATVEFAVTDKNGRIVFPKNGNVVTVREGTPLAVELDVNSVKAGDAYYFVVMNPSVDRVVCVMNIGVNLNNKAYNNGSGQLYDGILQGGNGWYHQYAARVTKSVAPPLENDDEDNTPSSQPQQPSGGGNTVTDPSYTIESQTNGFVEMKAFMDGWWWADAQGQNPASPSFGMANGTHTQPAAPGYMTAKGYKITTAGTYTFSGTVMLDINKHMAVPENADAVGFMVIEKNSNMVLYPKGKADFMVMKNTEENRTTPTMLSGTFEAKAGDEILFITRNELADKTPSVQVIMDVYREENGTKTKVGNTHEQFSGTQGKNGWRYYYASIKGFKTPLVPAANIFDKAAHYDTGKNAWYLVPEAVNETVVSSYHASIGKDAVTLTQHTGAAIGYKAPSAGKVSFSFAHKGVPAEKKIGFTVVKKSTFEKVIAWKLLDSKAQTVTGSFNASAGDEYLFVLAMLGTGEEAIVSVTLQVGKSTLSAAVSGKQGNANLHYYFAPVDDICTELLGTKRDESPYLAADDPGIKNVVFDPHQLTQFDEEKWMWSVSDWENPSSDGYMAVILESAQVSTPNYSMVRSYEAQSDCVLSVYGNLSSEVPEFIGAAPNEALFDFMVCNSKGQIMYPEDQSGFYSFKASDLTVEKPILINVSAKVTAGDKVYVVFRNRSDKAFTYLYTHFQIFETPEGENPSVPLTGAAEGFSDTQGGNGWNYYYTTNDSYRLVKGTKLDKVITGTVPDGTDKNDDKEDTPDTEAGNNTLAVVMFWVSAGVDVLCIALLVLYILWKIRKQKQTAVPSPVEASEQPTDEDRPEVPAEKEDP